MTPVKRAEEIVKLLNEACALDPVAIGRLMNARVPCNSALANHPTIQVEGIHSDGGKTEFRVGALGLLNGLVGVQDNDWGYIAMHWDWRTQRAVGFHVLPPQPPAESEHAA